MKKYIEGNRKAWNTASYYHHKARAEEWINGFKTPGYTGFDEFDYSLYNQLPWKGKSVVQAPCNNGREILSFINMGAAEGVGFDICDENIAFAEKLREVSGIDAEFRRTDVYEIDSSYHDRFDIGIISVGSITWMPDLVEYFKLYKRLLKENGILFIYEMHPVTTVFPYRFTADKTIVMEDSYFEKEVITTTDSLDYYGNVAYESPMQYNFQHTMSDIIQTLIDLKFGINEFREYPHDVGGGHEYLEGKLPLSYHLRAVRL